jgi:hypothetical protein
MPHHWPSKQVPARPCACAGHDGQRATWCSYSNVAAPWSRKCSSARRSSGAGARSTSPTAGAASPRGRSLLPAYHDPRDEHVGPGVHGIKSALRQARQARAVAGERAMAVGAADAARQYLKAGLLDEIHITSSRPPRRRRPPRPRMQPRGRIRRRHPPPLPRAGAERHTLSRRCSSASAEDDETPCFVRPA